MKYTKRIENLLKLKVPFDKNGNQLMQYMHNVFGSDVGCGDVGLKSITYVSDVKLIDNYIFTDTLIFLYSRRNYIVFKRKTTGTKVIMHTFAFSSVAPFLNKGRVTGNFIFYRKGLIFGCKMIDI